MGCQDPFAVGMESGVCTRFSQPSRIPRKVFTNSKAKWTAAMVPLPARPPTAHAEPGLPRCWGPASLADGQRATYPPETPIDPHSGTEAGGAIEIVPYEGRWPEEFRRDY